MIYFSKKVFKYFIGCKDDEKVQPLHNGSKNEWICKKF